MKWLAPEQAGLDSGEKRIYTKATDVWSYGITVWEIFSKGREQTWGQRYAREANYMCVIWLTM